MEYFSLPTTLRKRVRQAIASPTVRTISGLAGGNWLAMIIGIVGSLVQARFLMPEDLGYFRSFTIVTGYVFFLQLGFFGVLSRFFPYYIGKGQKERALAVAEICQAWILLITILVCTAYGILAIRALLIGNWRAFLGWAVQIVAISGFFYGGYLGATYRTGHDFRTVVRGSLLSSFVSLFSLPVFLIAPYLALALKSSLGNLSNLIFLHLRRPLRLGWRLNWREWRDLAKVSLPMFAADYGSSTGWAVVETTFILSFLGAGPLGLWSMSFILLEGASKAAQAITAVYNPRVMESFGRTEDVRKTVTLCRKPLVMGAPAMLLLAGVGALLLPFVVPVLMPFYAAAVPTMALMLLNLPLTVLELPSTVLVAMGKIAQLNIATYVGLGSFVVLALASLRLGLQLPGVVGASLLGRVIRLTIVYRYLYVESHKANPSGSA